MADDLRNYKLQLQQVNKQKTIPTFITWFPMKIVLRPILALNLNNVPTSVVFQVEAALLTDADNEELLKLKTDLEEVIELTQDLIKTQEGEPKVPNIHGSSNDDDVTASLLAAEEGGRYTDSKWQVGEKCLAKWRADAM